MAGRLTATGVQNLRPKAKAQKYFDGDGMYLLVNKAGKYWRLDYRFGKKRKTLSIGVYPTVGLHQARKKTQEAKQLLAEGIDPSQHKQVQIVQSVIAAENSFQSVALEWMDVRGGKWAESTRKAKKLRLEKHVFPYLGKRSITSITAPELLAVLRRIEATGAHETTHKLKQYCSQIFRYAIAASKAERDPAQDITGALKPVCVTHHASITSPREIGALLRAIDGYTGSLITRCALQLAPLVFVRPGELRKAEWLEMDFEQKQWRIPAEKMKARAVHIVPLSTQSVAVLEKIREYTGNDMYVFPSVRTITRPMSENTITAALRRLGYSGKEMTAHGFRSMASTLLNERGWNADAIERQLAHAERNAIRAAYNYAEYLPERTEMMQAWADYLDSLRAHQLKTLSA